ncbi:MAG TPA: UDP-3-O-(3-hydroxymyristoyl)glucosamine N-acyltransferase [Pyrinomonadaceae bacterium]|jgi:UDP-3-O-[3-hydroxymyristoyl] glucosamine N-acyltransferase
MLNEFTVAELAEKIGAQVRGDGETKITGINSLEAAQTGEIAFVEDARFFAGAANSAASCLIIAETAEIKFNGVLIQTKNPKLAFARIAALLHPPKKREAEIHPSAVIAESAAIGENVFVGAFCCVGENSSLGAGTQLRAGAKIGDRVRVGENCVFHPNVFVDDNVTIGNNVILHAGVIIGADGFGYVRDTDEYVKFPQLGTVVIEDDVEIGANSCVDRAALRGETRIGRGTKIDNLVQVAHNVSIGERVVIASQTGISGSTVIESDCVIGGQVGFGDHARVLSGAVIGSKAGVLPGKIVRAGVWWGVPVQPLDEYKRQNAMVKGLPRLREEVKEMRRELEDLKSNRGNG